MDKEYKISIEPKILQLLGPNLYTNIYYVLAELIANAYDAGAHNVYIDVSSDQILVEDDGRGMSYEKEEIHKFLRVAEESRSSKEEENVPGTNRKKMGRKGVGKLAALSVSDDVYVYTRSGQELSGFILSVNVKEDKLLQPVPEQNIEFKFVSGNGTAIIMPNPRYELHKRISTIKKNLVKIFPQISEDFKIHIKMGDSIETISSYDEELVGQLGGLIIFGEEFYGLSAYFDSGLGDEHNSALLDFKNEVVLPVKMKNNFGKESKINLEVAGWIGIFKTTSGKKKSNDDFPDNAISIVSHGKLGEYNVLPVVGKNSLSEVYIVGQLHVDAFEDSNFPDMALSNRQGYKFDDPRYQAFLKHLRDDILPKAISLRTKWASINKAQKDKKKNEKKKENERLLSEQLKKYKEETPRKVAKSFSLLMQHGGQPSEEDIEKSISKDINSSLPDAGLKASVDGAKKRILISHSSKNKVLCDLISEVLVFNGVPEDVMLYTSSENADMRTPYGTDVFDYIRDFFVQSASTEMMFVLYVTSHEMKASWAALCEVGAGWVVKSDHDIFNIVDFEPSAPLNVGPEWHNCLVDGNVISMNAKGVDLMADKILNICKKIGFSPKSKEDIKNKINDVVDVAE